MIETVERIICNHCGEPIEPNCGYIVQGNIYRTKETLDERGGIIGNNFPDTISGEFMVCDINEVAYHKTCLFEILDPVEVTS